MEDSCLARDFHEGPFDDAAREFFRGAGLVTQIGVTVVVAIAIGFAGDFTLADGLIQVALSRLGHVACRARS